MPADGNVFRFPTALREVPSFTSSGTGDHPMANAFGHAPVEPITSKAPPSRFMPAEDEGAVYVGTVRFDRYQVAALAALFSREAARSGDWSLYDQLNAARDGFAPEPPEAA